MIGMFVAASLALLSDGAPASPSPVSASALCAAAAEKEYGVSAITVGTTTPVPRRLVYVPPVFPAPSPTNHPSGSWVGEVLIAPDGQVQNVWVVREFSLKQPWPEFSRGIPDAIRRWRYSSTTAMGKAVPACMTVAVHIEAR